MDFYKLTKHNTLETCIEDIPIIAYKGVFLPQKELTHSTYQTLNNFPQVTNKKVLDVGTGTGILAIKSKINGAYLVDAIDICPEAVKNAKYNVMKNSQNIAVFQSNLFENVTKQYDVIFANLPIHYGQYKKNTVDIVDKFLTDAKKHMLENSFILLNWFSIINTNKIRQNILSKGYEYEEIKEKKLGYDWSLFKITKTQL